MSDSGSVHAGGALAVVAGVVRRPDGAVLISLRPRHKHQGGLWEFPGGKVEGDECTVDALARELAEELGIVVRRTLPLIRVWHAYPDKYVCLNVLEVLDWAGEPRGQEGQSIRWVAAESLSSYAFPAANLPIVSAVRLPSVALIAEHVEDDDDTFLPRLEACLASGVDLVCMVSRCGGGRRATEAAQRAAELCRQHGTRLTLDSAIETTADVPGAGLHLSAAALRRLRQRPCSRQRLLSACCDRPDELRHARTIGVDFACLTTAGASTFDAVMAALGSAGSDSRARQASCPVFASGRVGAVDVGAARRAGFQGIAMSSGLWDAAHPAAVIAACRTSIADAAHHLDRASKLAAP
ncbi:MAG: Nudix family hydrolase [Gammaproteobacteria bacterium]